VGSKGAPLPQMDSWAAHTRKASTMKGNGALILRAPSGMAEIDLRESL
jgi:hypothetical protein